MSGRGPVADGTYRDDLADLPVRLGPRPSGNEEAGHCPDGDPAVGAPPRGRRSVEEWLSLIIVGSLAVYLVIGVVTWSWMILSGVPAPAGFTTVLTGIAGAMAGIAAPLRPPTGNRGAAHRPENRREGAAR
jgi:hypothetical protein